MAAQISSDIDTPQPMINAMLQQLESMGKAVRIQEEPDGCLSGGCKAPEGKPVCASGGAALTYSIVIWKARYASASGFCVRFP